MYQVPAPGRHAFTDAVGGLPGRIANEHPDTLRYAGLGEPPDGALHNVLALDGTPLAWKRSHGQGMTWFASPERGTGKALRYHADGTTMRS
jgi:hypothetical protein